MPLKCQVPDVFSMSSASVAYFVDHDPIVRNSRNVARTSFCKLSSGVVCNITAFADLHWISAVSSIVASSTLVLFALFSTTEVLGWQGAVKPMVAMSISTIGVVDLASLPFIRSVLSSRSSEDEDADR